MRITRLGIAASVKSNVPQHMPVSVLERLIICSSNMHVLAADNYHLIGGFRLRISTHVVIIPCDRCIECLACRAKGEIMKTSIRFAFSISEVTPRRYGRYC